MYLGGIRCWVPLYFFSCPLLFLFLEPSLFFFFFFLFSFSKKTSFNFSHLKFSLARLIDSPSSWVWFENSHSRNKSAVKVLFRR